MPFLSTSQYTALSSSLLCGPTTSPSSGSSSTGSTGPQGASGSTGATGTTGATGSTGYTGTTGPTGAAGTIFSGTPGQVAYFTSGTPTNPVTGATNITTNGNLLTLGGGAGVTNLTAAASTIQDLQVLRALVSLTTPFITAGSLQANGSFVDFGAALSQSTFVIAGWRFTWGHALIFSDTNYNFTVPFALAPVVLVNQFGTVNQTISVSATNASFFRVKHAIPVPPAPGVFFLAIGTA